MKIYLSLLRTPGVARIIAAQLTARFPGGMLSLAYLLHIERIHDSYGAAGLVLAATSVGQAIAGPLTSRWMGVWGMRPVLAITTAICALSILTVGFVADDDSDHHARRIHRRAELPARAARGAHHLPEDGELAAAHPAVLARRVGAGDHLGRGSGDHDPRRDADLDHRSRSCCASCSSSAAACGSSRRPSSGACASRAASARSARCVTRPSVLLMTVVGVTMVGSFAAVEAGVVATFGHGDPGSGIVLAVFAAGSLIGGLAFGHLLDRAVDARAARGHHPGRLGDRGALAQHLVALDRALHRRASASPPRSPRSSRSSRRA